MFKGGKYRVPGVCPPHFTVRARAAPRSLRVYGGLWEAFETLFHADTSFRFLQILGISDQHLEEGQIT